MDRDQVAYVPELFDIHVMAFADDSETTVQALQEIFHIQRSDAQRLIVDAPVVVKRAATPDLADVLLDALQQIGAQVVIMPARERERPRAAAPAPQAFAAQPPPAPARPATPVPPATSAANWGGLDLDVDRDRSRTRQQTPTDLSRAPQPTPTEPWKRFSSMPAALGGGEEFEPDDYSAHSDPLELDVHGEGANDRMRAALAAAERGRAMAPAAELSLPPSQRNSLRSPGAASLAPPTRRSDGFDHAPLSHSLPPTSLAPPQRDAASLRPPTAPGSPPPPPHGKRAQPPPPPGAAPPRPPPPPRKPGMPPPPPPQAGTDLGLGTVPPLPPLLSAPEGGARRDSLSAAPRSSFRPVTSERPRFQHREMEALPELHLPRIDVSTPLLRPTSQADAAANASPPKPGAATSASKDKDPTLTGLNTRGNAAAREPSQRIATESAAKKPDAPAAEKPRAVPARGRALLEVAAGLLVFYLGLHMDNSILHGDASITWLILHAFGLYAIGSGIAGLWPS